MTPEEKKRVTEELKAMKNLKPDGNGTAEKREGQLPSSMDMEDMMEIFIPYEKLGRGKKV